MKVATKIVFLFKDSDGLPIAFANSLHPPPNSLSAVCKKESFELSLVQYGIKDLKASGDLVHFMDSDGNYQVSVLLLEKYEPPILVCAVTEVLTQIGGESSGLPTLIVPFVGVPSKLKWESKSLIPNNAKVSLYSVQVGPETEINKAIASITQKPPSSLQIHHEPLACFLQLVRILKLPTSIVIGKRGQGPLDKAAGEELEIIYEMGKLLENTISLCFLKEKITWDPAKVSKHSKEPWQALYG